MTEQEGAPRREASARARESSTGSPRAAERRRIAKSRMLMGGLGALAIVLTVGGIAAPQVVYALEAANFKTLASDAEAKAVEAAELDQREQSETLLFALRSTEAKELPAKLTGLSISPSEALSNDFKRAIGTSSKQLSTVLKAGGDVKTPAAAVKKATDARDADPSSAHSWFDVDSEQLAFYADIPLEEPTVDLKSGTVTRELVREAKTILSDNDKAVAVLSESVAELSGRNEELARAVAQASQQVVAEAGRASAATLSALDARAEEDAARGLTEAETEAADKLRALANDLEARSKAKIFVELPDGNVQGLAAGTELPAGAVRIPDGDAVRLKYVLSTLQEFAAADVADRTVRAEVQAAREAEAAAAAAAAAAEAQRQRTNAGSGFTWEGSGTTTGEAPAGPNTSTQPDTEAKPGDETGVQPGGETEEEPADEPEADRL